MLSVILKNGCRFVQPKITIKVHRFDAFRSFRNESRATESKFTQKPGSIRQRLMGPATDTPFRIGQGALIGGSALGIGALCFYGLGLSNGVGAMEKSYLWSKQVKDRISTTYMYFGGSTLITGLTAAQIFRTPALMKIVASPSILSMVATIGALIISGSILHNIEYKEGFGPKQLAWIVHSSLVGAVLAPICVLGGPILTRAALYTFGVFGGLSTIAMCAPSDKFLMMAGPLSMGLGVVFVSSLGSAFLPVSSALGASLYSISMYGGLILFSGLLLYDTQRIVVTAEQEYFKYDPINQSLSIYMDTINIFIRLAMLLSGSGGNRRK